MSSPKNRTFVGFGFGAIQSGLFLYEASRSGNFQRMIVGEVMPDIVDSIRRAQGNFAVNIAHSDRIEIASVGPIDIENPHSESGRRRLIEAVEAADEIATAVPSVQHYVTESAGSIHRVLAEGLRRKASTRGSAAVIYAAENHNEAAEILRDSVLAEIPAVERARTISGIQFLNTVIGKMSGTVTDPSEIRMRGLTTVTPGYPRAFLVEAFNRILISRIHPGEIGTHTPFCRGLEIFEEKDDLIPFEEAKLYGHNATHALASYVGAMKGVARIAELRSFGDIMEFLRTAFIHESGSALIQKHRGKDPLFTPEGYRTYAEDLLERMLNPFLLDTVERVGRDPERKLGWDDRLIGTMRLALQQGIRPHRYAFGAAAAVAILDRSWQEKGTPGITRLEQLWKPCSPNGIEKRAILDLLEEGRSLLYRWRRSDYGDLERLFA